MKLLWYFLFTAIFSGVLPAGNSEGGWLIYRQGPFKGRVIDAESKEPLEGAVVVAQYHVLQLTVVGFRTELIDVQEALTDGRGEFQIPVYTTVINPLSKGEDVSFLIWKPGYRKEIMWGGYFFEKEPGTVEKRTVQTDKGYEIKPVRLGILELQLLRTSKERRSNLVGPIGDKHEWNKQREFLKMIRKEWEYITGKPAGDLYIIEEGKE